MVLEMDFLFRPLFTLDDDNDDGDDDDDDDEPYDDVISQTRHV